MLKNETHTSRNTHTPALPHSEHNAHNKDNKNQTLAQDFPPLILDRLLATIAEKDAIIREQAEELGRLREQVEQHKKEGGRAAPDAGPPDITHG